MNISLVIVFDILGVFGIWLVELMFNCFINLFIVVLDIGCGIFKFIFIYLIFFGIYIFDLVLKYEVNK